MDEWIKKMRFTHTMEYYSALKKIEILPFTITWIYLEGIMLSETRQTQRDLLCAVAIKNWYSHSGVKKGFHRYYWMVKGGHGRKKLKKFFVKQNQLTSIANQSHRGVYLFCR